MPLPKSVQAQVEAAEALMNEVHKQVESAVSESAEHGELQVAGSPYVEQVAEQQPQPAPTSKSDEGTWEQRYKSLQGLFNARISELQASNKALTQQVQQLTQKLEDLSDTLAKRPEPVQHAIDPKDVENFGQDLVEMVQRQASAMLAGLAAKFEGALQALEKRLAVVEQQLSGTAQAVTMTAEDVFFSKLTQLVPDWEQINADERFLAWLAEEDPVYGQPRQAALTAAHRALDVKRVAAIFNTFKSQLAQQTQTPLKSIEKQVSPNTSGSSSPPKQVEKPVFTQAQIQAFYRDLTLGRYKGREKEAARIEQQINEAVAEGRVR